MHPDDLDRAADALLVVARQVTATIDRLVAHHRPDVWRGARARHFGTGLAEQRVRAHAVADHLADDARRLRSHAALLRTAGRL